MALFGQIIQDLLKTAPKMNLKDFGCGLVWTDQPYFSIWSNTGKKMDSFPKKPTKD